MKTVIDDSNVNDLIIGEYYERPITVEGVDYNTPFDEKYKWIGNKESRMAAGKSFVQGLQVIVTDPKRPNIPVQVRLSSYQVQKIAEWYNSVHNHFCDPVEVDPLDEY